jgi:hypothetical protein
VIEVDRALGDSIAESGCGDPWRRGRKGEEADQRGRAGDDQGCPHERERRPAAKVEPEQQSAGGREVQR